MIFQVAGPSEQCVSSDTDVADKLPSTDSAGSLAAGWLRGIVYALIDAKRQSLPDFEHVHEYIHQTVQTSEGNSH